MVEKCAEFATQHFHPPAAAPLTVAIGVNIIAHVLTVKKTGSKLACNIIDGLMIVYFRVGVKFSLSAPN